MIRTIPLLLLAGCSTLVELPATQPCLEAGYAIARRTEECTNDPQLANKRYEAFEKQTDCIARPVADTDALPGFGPEDLYACAGAIENLSCDTVAEYGNDIPLYLTHSNACDWVIE